MNPKASILIVDDESVVRDSLGKWLEEEGYSVDTASSGREALLKLPGQRWDLALLDIKCPAWMASSCSTRCERSIPTSLSSS